MTVLVYLVFGFIRSSRSQNLCSSGPSLSRALRSLSVLSGLIVLRRKDRALSTSWFSLSNQTLMVFSCCQIPQTCCLLADHYSDADPGDPHLCGLYHYHHPHHHHHHHHYHYNYHYQVCIIIIIFIIIRSASSSTGWL